MPPCCLSIICAGTDLLSYNNVPKIPESSKNDFRTMTNYAAQWIAPALSLTNHMDFLHSMFCNMKTKVNAANDLGFIYPGGGYLNSVRKRGHSAGFRV